MRGIGVTGGMHSHASDTPPDSREAYTRLIPAMARGFANRCPHCGEGHIFGRFLKVMPECERCGLEMHGHRADDLPPYATIFLVGHVVGYLILEFEMGYDLPLWFSVTVWPLLTLALVFALLQPVKGAVVGLQYAFAMHGFDRLPGAADAGTRGAEAAHHGTEDGANIAGGSGVRAASPVPRLGRV